MINKECTFYPCHEGLEDCTYCYCPIYPCGYEEFGKWIGEDNDIWDCSECLIFHKTKIAELLQENHPA